MLYEVITKESDVLNEDKNAFVTNEVAKKLKELRSDVVTEETLEFKNKLIQAENLMEEEKELKAQIKKDSAVLP